MTSIISPSGNGIGITPSTFITNMVNGTGGTLSPGDVVVVDFKQTYATTTAPGSLTSVFATVSLAADMNIQAGHGAGWAGVVQETIAAGEKGKVLFRGVTKVKAYCAATGIVAAGKYRLHTTAGEKTMSATGINFSKAFAVNLTNTTASAVNDGTAEEITVIFNGIEGMGHQ